MKATNDLKGTHLLTFIIVSFKTDGFSLSPYFTEVSKYYYLLRLGYAIYVRNCLICLQMILKFDSNDRLSLG